MATHAPAAVEVITKLTKGAESDSTKLKASRAKLSDKIHVSKYVGWGRRLAWVEKKVMGRAQGPTIQHWSEASGTYAPDAEVPTTE